MMMDSDAPLHIGSIPHDVLVKYKKKFDAIDLNKDGVITFREMATVGKVFGYKLDEAELREIFNKRDLDDSGTITFDEFVIGLLERQRRNARLEPIRQEFKRYDVKNKGYVTSDEAYPILRRELGFDMNKTESIIDMFDKNRDYRLSMHEFRPFLQKVAELKAQIVAAFRSFDKNGDGYIDYNEAREVMLQKGYSEAEVYDFFRRFDEDGDGRLNYSEFALFWDVPLFK